MVAMKYFFLLDTYIIFFFKVAHIYKYVYIYIYIIIVHSHTGNNIFSIL